MKFALFFALLHALAAQDSPGVAGARREMERVDGLVRTGALPPAKSIEAREALADAMDEDLLARTFAAQIRVEELTEQQASALIDAAQRRVDRIQFKLNKMNQLIASGAAPAADRPPLESELASRRETLGRAAKLVDLLREIAAMARAETRPPEENTAGTRFIGPKELQELTLAFEQKFSEPFPISARGMTAVHKALGLDHTGRVDVALRPDSPEGIWLRQYLTQRSIPYYAFRSAMPGKATAPHIHIGPGSTRL